MNAITPLTSHASVPNAPTKMPGIPRIAELYPLVHTPATLRMKGIGPRRLRNLIAGGTLQRIRRGAYIYNHNADQLNSDDRLRVRCIAADLVGFQGVFSHKSAAVLWGLDLLTVPQMLDAYSRSHCATDRERIHRHKTAISPDEVTRLPGTSIMVTTVARTLQDCARSMPFREAVVLADSIMRRGLLEPCEVTEILLNLTGIISISFLIRKCLLWKKNWLGIYQLEVSQFKVILIIRNQAVLRNQAQHQVQPLNQTLISIRRHRIEELEALIQRMMGMSLVRQM